ncbi:hypothetical protein F751_3970 [Auxenochlorella protothecoides]|uniref:Uncharacterized protein n=1 Tax=Auxenochlorella protothecoides TaxID=3075 RepID=A0A087SHT6_AUXPR|nr:hypothetical protein F751_3970 [Auxenochlorella protothecoides]KFM25290.1 hypothetical protein F751_3970 [Auxenochlorella protothecoides]
MLPGQGHRRLGMLVHFRTSTAGLSMVLGQTCTGHVSWRQDAHAVSDPGWHSPPIPRP